MAIGDIYQTIWDINVENQRCAMSLHFREQVASDNAIPALQLCVGLQSTILGNLTAIMSSQALVTSIYARRVSPTPSIPGQDLISVVSGAGERSADCTPPQCATIATLYTSVATKSGRGRIFIPGLAEEDQDTGQLTDMHISRVQTLMDNLLVATPAPGADPGEWVLAVWSPKDGVGRVVEHYVVRTNVGTLRSRRAIYGPGGTGT